MLTWWFVGLVWLAVIAVGLRVFLRRRPQRPVGPDAIRVANSRRWKSLPRYRTLATAWLRRALIQLVGLGLIATGGILLTTRLATASQLPAREHNRDIVLCLDVSGSMTSVDQAIMQTFVEIAGQLRGERIGLVIWDSSAVSIFPLTSDYAYVQAQLTEGISALANYANPWDEGVNEGSGSSLIGDGLASCAQRFDRLPTDPDDPVERSRTIILATDNSLAGDPIYTLAQAADQVVKNKIRVYALSPSGYGDDFTELSAQAQRTGGRAYDLSTGAPTEQVVRMINTTEAQELAGSARLVVHDEPLPAEVLIIVGLALIIGAGWRTPRPRRTSRDPEPTP